MQAKGEYCITAGEFAKMCQTTRDTLRYYERQGILVPKKNPVNGYRYYSYAQISSYYFIRTFRGLDCSVGDIKEYLLGGEEIRFDEFVEQQYDKLLLMRQELDRKIRTIAGTRQILDQIRAGLQDVRQLLRQPDHNLRHHAGRCGPRLCPGQCHRGRAPGAGGGAAAGLPGGCPGGADRPAGRSLCLTRQKIAAEMHLFHQKNNLHPPKVWCII